MTDQGECIGAAVQLASDVQGRRLALACLGDRYRLQVASDASGVGLWRR